MDMDGSRNIIFIYSYTNSAHEKTRAEIVFANPTGMGMGEIEYGIKSRLKDLEYFNHSDFMVSALYGEYPDLNENPVLHAFESVNPTDKEATDKRSIGDFIGNIK
ncbi:MAG TPA: hypothetical protein VM187_00645 [Niastella sp.]|nr:hypothetical protein [Niastella sp.]